MMLGKMPEARDKTITQVLLDAATTGGDPSPILTYRAQKAETLLKQIACNTDPVWARKLACDFWGIEPTQDCQHDWTPWVYRHGTQWVDPAEHSSRGRRFRVVHSMDRTCRKCRCSNYIQAGK